MRLSGYGKRHKGDRRERFTALFHHVYDAGDEGVLLLSVKRERQPGIDGETWQHYGQNP